MTIPTDPVDLGDRSYLEGLDAAEVQRRLERPRETVGALQPGGPLSVLDLVVGFLRRFVVFASKHQSHAVALWIAHTHAIEATQVTPRLHITSPERRCGKSRLMDLVDLLVAAPLAVVSVTEAAIFRTLANGPRTLLHDEVDAVFRPRAPENEGLRALINAGHARGRTVPRMEPSGRGFKMVEFPCFAPVALAGIGELPGTIADRSIRIRLQRRLSSEPIERFRRRAMLEPAERLREQVEEWVAAHLEVLAEAWPELPERLDDRAADGWEPLFAIADTTGGAWPERARAAAVALSGPGGVDSESVALQLLASTRAVFGGEEHGLWTKDELLPALNALEEAPWGAWNDGRGINPHELSRYLRQFGVQPQTMRKGQRTLKGYLVRDLEPLWKRYLELPRPPDSGSETSHRDKPLLTSGNGHFKDVTSTNHVTFRNPTKTASDQHCDVVTDENAEQGAQGGSDTLCVVCGQPCHPAFDPHPGCSLEEE